MPDAQINALIEKSFQSALEGKTDFFSAGFFSDAVLIGIGAPVHLFLAEYITVTKTGKAF